MTDMNKNNMNLHGALTNMHDETFGNLKDAFNNLIIPPIELQPPTFRIPKIVNHQERTNNLISEQNQTLREHLIESKETNQKLNFQYALLKQEFENNQTELIRTKKMNNFSLALNIVMFLIAVFSLLIAFFDLF